MKYNPKIQEDGGKKDYFLTLLDAVLAVVTVKNTQSNAATAAKNAFIQYQFVWKIF